MIVNLKDNKGNKIIENVRKINVIGKRHFQIICEGGCISYFDDAEIDSIDEHTPNLSDFKKATNNKIDEYIEDIKKDADNPDNCNDMRQILNFVANIETEHLKSFKEKIKNMTEFDFNQSEKIIID